MAPQSPQTAALPCTALHESPGCGSLPSLSDALFRPGLEAVLSP